MSFMDLARKRYSSREYKDTPVEQEKIDAILEAGRISPTAVNAQPVRVIAVRTPEGLSKVSEGANIYGAPLAFIVYADRSKAWVRKYDGMNSAEIDASIVKEGLEYQGIPEWDSVGHMGLVAALEDAFDIMMDTDDIIDFSSYNKGIEILSTKYNVEF